MWSKDVILGLLIPFAGTAGGSACVFFMRGKLNDKVERALSGFAAGVMVAASIWSLLIPAMEQSAGKGRWAFVPAVIGFWCGVLLLLFLDSVIPHLHVDSEKPEGIKSNLARTTMMVLAVTLHNIPEGMAVGVVYAGFLADNAEITIGAALALSIGIAIQNFPEGAIISMPLHANGKSRLPRRCAVRGGGTGLRSFDDPRGGASGADDAVPVELCGRRHDVRRCGGTGAGDVRGRAQQRRCPDVLRGLHADDGAGRGARVRRQALPALN